MDQDMTVFPFSPFLDIIMCIIYRPSGSIELIYCDLDPKFSDSVID